ncbi:hypothetical protein EB118_16765 [bacterium]|nr:hypothetical protein [Actinomycetota bacterium]NDG31708.1 hypothetical protein [bacterium]
MALLSAAIGQNATLIFHCNRGDFISKYPGTSYAITSMFFCNLSSNPSNLTVYLVPVGSTPTNTTTIFKNLNISPLDTFALDTEKIILGNGDAIYAAATNTDMSVILSIVRVA